MEMQKIVRLLKGLRDLGLSEREINDFLIYIESGDDEYKPKSKFSRGE